MSLGKRLFIGGAAECTTDTADIFGDNSGLALYSLDYDASDASGNYDGTASNVTFGEIGQINYAARFNGSSSEIDLPDIGGVSSLGTLSFWFKTSSTSSTAMTPFGAGRTGNSDNYTWAPIYITAGKISYGYMANNGGWLNGAARETTATYNDGNWHHVVVVYSGTYGINQTHTLYVDGTEITSTTDIGTQSASYLITDFSGQWSLGYYGAQDALYYTGELDQVRIFNKAISSSEVDTLYAEERCVYDSTTDSNDIGGTNVAYYKFDGDYTDEKGSYDATANATSGFKFGRYGTAVDFTGTMSRINTGYTKSGNEFGISMWVYVKDTGARQIMLGDFDTGGTNASGSISFGVYADDNFKINIGNGTTILTSVNTSFSGYYDKWTHVAVSIASDGKTATLYLDDNKTVGTTVTTAIQNGQNPIGLGHYSATANAGNEFQGLMDQVRIFSSALSDDDVDALYAEKQEHITLNSTDPFGDGDCEVYYKFDNNANDSSGNTYTATASNISYSSSDKLFGTHSADFTTASSKFEENTLTLTAMTVSMWVNIPDVTTTYNLVNMYEGEDRVFSIYNYQASNGFIAANYYNGNFNNSCTITASDYLTNNKWHHIVFAVNATTQPQLYIDGVLVKTATGSLGFSSETPDLEIGYNSSTYDFRGKMDQFRIFERKLTGQEVFQLYAEATLN